jgi:hypothetical protein
MLTIDESDLLQFSHILMHFKDEQSNRSVQQKQSINNHCVLTLRGHWYLGWGFRENSRWRPFPGILLFLARVSSGFKASFVYILFTLCAQKAVTTYRHVIQGQGGQLAEDKTFDLRRCLCHNSRNTPVCFTKSIHQVANP